MSIDIHDQTSRFVLSWFKNDATLHHVYKRGHTNLASYIIGMAMGYLAYDLQKDKVDPKNLRMYRYMVWGMVPVALICFYSGIIFYDSPSPPMYVHLLYAGLLKPVFALLIGSLVVSSVIRLEDLYRSIIEWRFWRIPSQLSYSAYLLHFFFVRKYAVTLTSTRVVSPWTVMYDVHIVVVHTMLAATVFWLLVDAPLANLRQYFFKTNIFEEKKKVK
ncbi:hypothetical protein HW555_013695 [Spodoptera exigua]|uniref:Acyltransferase 3 domain-containing protein n=1 Tax=Spodoptera exigua TaxID=7107 RepID=A0A835G481_SPOEX|nr:hypothetical protein HW555_013695 [Spodoptera exigua]